MNLQVLMAQLGFMSAENREYLRRMFSRAPEGFLEHLSLKKIEQGTLFIHENAPVGKVFFLLNGRVRGMEHRVLGVKYQYTQFEPVEIFGSMEILLGFDRYMATLETGTDCWFLITGREDYRRWISQDIDALLMETRSMGRYLLEQGRKERLLLFLQGRDRLFFLFCQEYQITGSEEKCTIRWTRQELSDCSGLSTRTVNRLVKTMQEDGYIEISSLIDESFIIIKIIDNGVGFDTNAIKNTSHGINNSSMRFKILLNATTIVESQLNIGTTIIIKIPFKERIDI